MTDDTRKWLVIVDQHGKEPNVVYYKETKLDDAIDRLRETFTDPTMRIERIRIEREGIL